MRINGHISGRVTMDGQIGWADGQIGYAGYGAHPVEGQQ